MLQQNALEFRLEAVRQKINTENLNYNEAVISGKEFRVAKQILQKIALLKKQAQHIKDHLHSTAGCLL